MQALGSLLKPSYRIGILSVLVVCMWGVIAWLRILASGVPPLELTGIALVGAAICSQLLPKMRHNAFKAAAKNHPWYAWLVIVTGLVGGAGFYFAALAYAPAAQVVVITYSWPLLFAIASDVYSGRRPSALTFMALLLGLAGVFVMHGLFQIPSSEAWLGYISGLASGLCWVAYSLFLQVYPRSIEPSYPAFFAVAAITALGLQAMVGDLVWPGSIDAWLSSLALGVGPYGIGFIAWGYIVRRGNPKVIPVLPYAVPVVAAITLILAGYTQPTPSLLAGCVLVISACTVISFARQPSNDTE